MAKFRILLLLLMCLFTCMASAKTVHLIIFTDDNDASIGTSCAQTRKYFSSTFIPNLKRYTSLPVVEKYGYGNRFTVANLNSTLSSLNTASDDVIIFYYAGHGYNQGYNDYPTLTLGVSGTPIAQRSKDLLDIYNLLQKKPHQLLLCIAEACNAVHRVNGIADNMITSFPSHVFSAKHFLELFNATGDYMVSSSIKGQKSYSAEGSPGMFTCGFRESFNELVETSYAGTATWSSVFSKTIANTEHIAMESGYEQTPQWLKGTYIADMFQVTKVEASGLDENNHSVGSSSIYASDVARLQFCVTYSSSKDINLVYRLSKSGTTLSNNESPQGYTWTIKFPKGTNKTITHNWGWPSKGNYTSGEYRYEIFKDGKSIYSKNFSLNRKYNETSYLTVNSKTSVSTSFSSDGGNRTFFVNTDGDSYTIEYLPSWCTITNKGEKTFVLNCSKNTLTSSRTDWFKVKSGEQSVKVEISQQANDNVVSGAIEKVWVEHNVIQYMGFQMVNGMKIHIKFTVNNMLNKSGNIQAYFWSQNGNKLLDFNSLYRASDGQVTVNGSFTPVYQNSVYNDYILFMPYSELHCGAGVNYLKFHVEVFENTSGRWRSFASSEFTNFTYTSY